MQKSHTKKHWRPLENTRKIKLDKLKKQCIIARMVIIKKSKKKYFQKKLDFFLIVRRIHNHRGGKHSGSTAL